MSRGGPALALAPARAADYHAHMFDPDAPATSDQLFGLPHTVEDARVVVLPVPWQATTSYRRGTREAPANVRAASWQVDLFDLELGEVWRQGFAGIEDDGVVAAWDHEAEADALAVIAAGGELPEAAARVNLLSERVNRHVYAATRATLDRGAIPGVLGGDHSVPFGAIRAVSERHPGVGVLHIDAHADLRDTYEGFTWSHASIFHNVVTRLGDVSRLVQVGLRDVGAGEVAFRDAHPRRITWFTDADLAARRLEGAPWSRSVQQIVAALPPEVYVSFDIDGLDPTLCPGTGTPVPGGLSWHEIVHLLAAVGTHRRIVGFDLNEVGPTQWDAIVGARVLYRLCGWAARSNPG